jgi:hypothetical protein
MNRQRFEFLFTYTLSRPYPFRWFTYAVLIGGLICVGVFSFVSLAADGYNLDPVYTFDLNRTLEENYWFGKPPFSWISKTQVSCQPALLTTGGTFFTSKLGLTYTIDRLRHANSIDKEDRILSATAYQNTVLRDCEVRGINIDFMRRDYTRWPQNWWSWGLTSASVCSIDYFIIPRA